MTSESGTMETKTVDARGLPCPQPVTKTRDAMDEYTEVIAIVDNDTAERNVTRMAEKAGAAVMADKGEDGVRLHITRHASSGKMVSKEEDEAASDGPLILLVTSEFMGRGEHDQLGHILMRGFFHTLGEIEPMPDAVIFVNSGVKLVVEGAPVVEDLQALIEKGVEVLACGTCLGYYELEDAVAVGKISNMYTIAETILAAGKLVNL